MMTYEEERKTEKFSLAVAPFIEVQSKNRLTRRSVWGEWGGYKVVSLYKACPLDGGRREEVFLEWRY